MSSLLNFRRLERALLNEPIWVPPEVVIEHNRRELSGTTEQHFVRDRGGLDSALARPRNAFAYGEEDIVTLAVLLLAGVAFAHAFEQGNKRTAFATMGLFLRANGYDIIMDDRVDWADEIVKLIERQITEAELVGLLKPFVIERPL